ncbi:ABC-type branched-subunit amino acid transport system substrate-binding protein [Bradyrhizobium sp. LM2.7]
MRISEPGCFALPGLVNEVLDWRETYESKLPVFPGVVRTRRYITDSCCRDISPGASPALGDFLMYRFRLATPIILTIALLAATMLSARGEETGVSDDAILFGQAAALEGPSSALGQRMRQGIVAAFTEINAKGGVHGRKLRLLSRDDGYDPDRSVAQTLRLIEEDKVFALIGAVGTPTAIATIPITSARGVPFIGPFSGA